MQPDCQFGLFPVLQAYVTITTALRYAYLSYVTMYQGGVQYVTW